MDKAGILLGRFQPPHLGHFQLIQEISYENDVLIICIGSSQLSVPFNINQRKTIIRRQLDKLNITNYKLYSFKDPMPIDSWVKVLYKTCNLSQYEPVTLYRSDRDLESFEEEIWDLNIRIKYVARKPFYYLTSDGFYVKINSATDLRNIEKNIRYNGTCYYGK